jgi:class 3 adenylate cyclase
VDAGSEVEYARTDDGVDIAYTVSGDGDQAVVILHGFTTHLDFVWESPWHATWANQLAAHFRVVQLDKRGTGLSDRLLGTGSVEQRSRDVTAVMDAAGIDRASLVGISEGAPMALVTAATRPERVDRMVLYGGFARTLYAEDYPHGATAEMVEEFASWIGANWGTGRVIGTMFTESPPTMLPALARFERNACGRQLAELIMRMNSTIDVRPLVPLVTAPTLVLHNAGDVVVPGAWGRAIADLLPSAAYEEFEGDFHCTSYVDRALPRVHAAIDFLLGSQRPAAPTSTGSRRLASVLFTDLVDSTARASAVGDRAWREILEQHDWRANAAVEAAGGRLVSSTGDGILAVFDGPSDAISCGRQVALLMQTLGLKVRAGVHTGEVELRGADVGGIGVHLAARVAALAGPDEILVSRTVRDLTLGSDLDYQSRGVHVLKGVTGEWELFAVRPTANASS